MSRKISKNFSGLHTDEKKR